MKIIVPGGSGLLGSLIASRCHRRGDEVVVLSRRPQATPWRTERWDAKTVGPWATHLEGADAVVNLAGRSVNCRLTEANRREVLDSRVDSTRAVGEAIAACKAPPKAWLQASTATIYAHRYDAGNDETTGIIGGLEPDLPETWAFSVKVAKAWEAALAESSLAQTRKVALRTSLVMSPAKHSVFDVLMNLAKRGLGGRNGDGKQYVSWIHERDFLNAIDWVIAHNELSGPVNITAPNPLSQARLMKAMRDAAGIRMALPATRWMLEIGAFFLRTETELILKSRRVLPGFLLESGFGFEFPAWPEAAAEITSRWQESH